MTLFIKKHNLIISILISLFALSVSNAAYAEKISQAEFSKRIKEEEAQNTKYILAEALNKSKALLDTHGDFGPFGLGLFPDGNTRFVWLTKPGQVAKDPVQAIYILRSTLHEQFKGAAMMGSAIAYTFKADESARRQINIEVEYITGNAKLVSATYDLDEDKKVVWKNIKEATSKAFVYRNTTEKEQKL